MRRAIALAVGSGVVLGGTAAGPAWAREVTDVKAAPAATKTVVYAGYELRVPASWPVYRLDENPSTCVRYDVPAVYLGTPGDNQRCPAGLLGRTETVSIIPGTVVAAGAGSETTDQRAQPFQAGATEVATLPVVRATVTGNAEQHQLRVALGASGRGASATVVATYGASPAAVEQVLATLRGAPGAARAVVQATSPAQQLQAAPQSPAVGAAWRGVPPGWPTQIVVSPTPTPTPTPTRTPTPTPTPTSTPPPVPPPARPVLGFDTCTAPSLATMKAWRRAYAAVGVYIGGANAACAYGNLSAKWVQAAQGMGWGLIPTYVGPQAPCYGYGVLIDPKRAASQGKAAGDDAAGDAQLLGLPPGSPIYYDMEAYDNKAAGCTAAVLTFLGAWDSEVTARGYLTGVYSSQDSGIDDMEAAAVTKTPGFTVPRAIWIAHWDNQATLRDGSLVWPLQERSKQYQGPHNRTVGGITLNIDGDLAGGPLAR
jgi:Rv2525c-like, glycoside hydrolase-like domain